MALAPPSLRKQDPSYMVKFIAIPHCTATFPPVRLENNNIKGQAFHLGPGPRLPFFCRTSFSGYLFSLPLIDVFQSLSSTSVSHLKNTSSYDKMTLSVSHLSSSIIHWPIFLSLFTEKLLGKCLHQLSLHPYLLFTLQPSPTWLPSLPAQRKRLLSSR